MAHGVRPLARKISAQRRFAQGGFTPPEHGKTGVPAKSYFVGRMTNSWMTCPIAVTRKEQEETEG